MLDFLYNIDISAKILLIIMFLIYILFNILSFKVLNKLKGIFLFFNTLLFLILTIFISSDNILINYFAIFWYLLIVHFLKTSFATNENNKKIFSLGFIFDLTCYFSSVILLLFSFTRYFLLNNINLTYTNIENNLYEISEFHIILFLIAILILISRFLNLLPFNFSQNIESKKINPIISSVEIISSSILITSLITKIYPIFREYIFNYQEIISIFLLINFIYILLLSFKENDLIRYFAKIFSLNYIIILFYLLNTNSDSLLNYTYYSITLILSILITLCLSIFLYDKFKSTNIFKLPQIKDKTKSIQILVLISFLNIAKIAPFGLLIPTYIILIDIFSNYNDGLILIIPYALCIGLFIMALSIINLVEKILIEPKEKTYQLSFDKYQICIMIILIISVLIFSILPAFINNDFSYIGVI